MSVDTESRFVWLRRWPEEPVSAAALAVAVGLALWLTAGVWGDRPPAGEDTMGHLVLTQFAIDELFLRGKIDGWQPRFMLGFELFLFMGPGFAWTVAAVRALSLGQLSTLGAFRLVDIGSFVTFPLAVAFLARSFGLPRSAAGIAAILTLAVNSPFGGVGLHGLFEVGLILHQLGAIWFCLSLGGVLRVLSNPDWRWTVFTGASMAALILTHARSAVVLLVVASIVVLAVVFRHAVAKAWAEQALFLGRRRLRGLVRHELRGELVRLGLAPEPAAVVEAGPRQAPDVVLSREAFVHLLAAGWLGLGLAALYVIPILAHRDLMGGLTGWPEPTMVERLRSIWRGESLIRPGVAPIVVAGGVAALLRVFERRPYALALVVTPIVYVVVAYWAVEQWPGSVLAAQLPQRGLGFAVMLAMFPLAVILARAGRLLGKIGQATAIAAAAAIVVLPLGPWREAARPMPDPVPPMHAAAAELRDLVPAGARFATQRDYPGEIQRTGVKNPDRWLAWASGRNTLNVFSLESSQTRGAALAPEYFDQQPPEVTAEKMARYGVTHVVAVSDTMAQVLQGSRRLSLVWRASPLAIFAVAPQPGQPDPGALITAEAPLRARLDRFLPGVLDIRVGSRGATRARVAVAWSPKWHARLDGEPVPLRRAEDGRLELDLPPGTSRLSLRFRPDLWDHLGLVVSLVSLVGLISLAALRRSRPAAGDTPEP
ncbi:MAG TPA: hypothetical protein VFG78_02590 [Gemmatimonadota bacterium]|nr:hypothetical protein [Gemmatimonadota bacterium]